MAVDLTAGIDRAAIDPGPRPRGIQLGENKDAYTDALFGRSLELWHGLSVCTVAIDTAGAAARRINRAGE